MEPKEKGDTEHKSNNHIQGKQKWEQNHNPNRKDSPLLFMPRTLKFAKMPLDKLVEADILWSFKGQINITVSLTMQNLVSKCQIGFFLSFVLYLCPNILFLLPATIQISLYLTLDYSTHFCKEKVRMQDCTQMQGWAFWDSSSKALWCKFNSQHFKWHKATHTLEMQHT